MMTSHDLFKKWKNENMDDLEYIYNKYILCNTHIFMCSFERFCFYCFKNSYSSHS